MLRKVFMSVAVLAGGIWATAGLFSTAVSADEKKDDKEKSALSGAWAKKDGEMKIEFVEKDVIKLFPHGDNQVVVILCKYTIDKKGLVKAKITAVEGKEKEKAERIIPVGLEFRFKWAAKNDTATIDDVTGDNIDLLKSHLEGQFKQKK